MPGHWPVHVAVRADGSGGGADEDFLYTLECVPESFRRKDAWPWCG